MNWKHKINIRKKIRFIIYEKFILPCNQFKSFFGIRYENKIPRLIIHEKFKNIVKWTTRILTLIGIFSSLVSIPNRYLSLLIALMFFALQRSLEKVIFRFTTIFIAPMPDFIWDKKEWNGMGYLYSENLKDLSFFGPAFVHKDYGIKVFKLLLAWNYNSYNDIESNVCISFVENCNNYYVYIYPSLNRKSIIEFSNKTETSEENKNKDHHQLVMQMILCQSFPLSDISIYHKWKELCLAGQPIYLGVFTYDEKNKIIRPIEDITPIRVYRVNFKKKKELDKKDIEYSYGKYIIGF